MAGLLFLSGCLAPAGPKLAYTPEEIRSELTARLPERSPDEILVPFEVSEQNLERAQGLVPSYGPPSERIFTLARVLGSETGFGLSYNPAITESADRVIELGRGNCLSLSSVLIGLAREMGLKAYYMDASDRVNEIRGDENLVVWTGHVTAAVETADGLKVIDFDGEVSKSRSFDLLDDFQAIAHFHVSRGYTLIHEARSSEQPIPWEQVREAFEVATRIGSDVPSAWNNLGIANARLGNAEVAKEQYRTAIALQPSLGAAHNNLGILHMRENDLDVAIEFFSTAAELEPENPYLAYQLGDTLRMNGDMERAAEQFHRALALKPDYQAARDALAALDLEWTAIDGSGG